MSNLKKENYLQILFILSILILSSALIIEYGFGYQPCNLCKIERIPYGLAIIILVLNNIFRKDQSFYGVLLMLIFSFSIIISVYHFGIEQGLIEESKVCASKNLNLLTKEDVLNSLNWSIEVGGINELVKISENNLKIVSDWIESNENFEFLANFCIFNKCLLC